MARSRTRLGYIRDNGSGRSSTKARTQSLVNKVREISTFCDINASIVVYGPGNLDPVVWPSQVGAERLIHRFNSIPAFDSRQRMEKQETFSNKEADEVDAKLKKLQNKNRLRELSLVLDTSRNDGEWEKHQSSVYLGNLNDDVLKPLMEQLEKRKAILTPGPSTPPQQN